MPPTYNVVLPNPAEDVEEVKGLIVIFIKDGWYLRARDVFWNILR
jgi:hypothetical protein